MRFEVKMKKLYFCTTLINVTRKFSILISELALIIQELECYSYMLGDKDIDTNRRYCYHHNNSRNLLEYFFYFPFKRDLYIILVLRYFSLYPH